jgi:hypothetical protein
MMWDDATKDMNPDSSNFISHLVKRRIQYKDQHGGAFRE